MEKKYAGDPNVSEEVFEEIYKRLKKKLKIGKTPVDDPTAIVLGGQPGAGKRNIYEIEGKRFKGNLVEVDCDTFRILHPDHDKLNEDTEHFGELTNPFVFALSDRLVDELSQENYNLIVENSLRSKGSAIWFHDLFSKNGYKNIELAIMATPKDISKQGIKDRYEKDLKEGKLARFVPDYVHDAVVENIANVLNAVYVENLFSNIRMYNREQKCLYDMSLQPRVNPSPLLSNVINQTQELIKYQDSKFLEAEKKSIPSIKVTSSDHPQIPIGSYSLLDFYELTRKYGAEQGKTYDISYAIENIMVSDKTVNELNFDQQIGNGSKPFSEHVKDVIKEEVGTGFVLNGKVSPEREVINNIFEWTVPHINSRLLREAQELEKTNPKHKKHDGPRR